MCAQHIVWLSLILGKNVIRATGLLSVDIRKKNLNYNFFLYLVNAIQATLPHQRSIACRAIIGVGAFVLPLPVFRGCFWHWEKGKQVSQYLAKIVCSAWMTKKIWFQASQTYLNFISSIHQCDGEREKCDVHEWCYLFSVISRTTFVNMKRKRKKANTKRTAVKCH